MVKEVWDSFKDNIKERVTNPFLGTFALVWIVHNWQIVYSFFFFDSNTKLADKISFFKKYWNEHSFICNLLWVAGVTILVLITTYLFLGISRFLANSFENRVIPLISKWTKGKIYTKEQFDELVAKVETLESKLEAERKLKNEAINERESIEKRFYQSTNSSVDNKTDTDEVIIKADYSELIKTLIEEFGGGLIEETFLKIMKGYDFSTHNLFVDYLLKKNFIEVDNITNANFNKMSGTIYKFTNSGLDLKNQYFNKS